MTFSLTFFSLYLPCHLTNLRMLSLLTCSTVFLYLVTTQSHPLHSLLLKERQFLTGSTFLPLLLPSFLCGFGFILILFFIYTLHFVSSAIYTKICAKLPLFHLVLTYCPFLVAVDNNRSVFEGDMNRIPADSQRIPL